MAVASLQSLGLPKDLTADAAAWLAGLFIAPLTSHAIEEQLSPTGASLLDAMGDALRCRPGSDGMRLALGASNSVLAAERHLGRAYTRLFAGVSGHATVSLYESAYGANGARLFQRSTGDIESLLQSCGLSVTSDCGEPADHLSVELAFLSAAMRADDDRTASVLSERLGNWVPEFCAQCEFRDTTGYYSGAAMLLNGLFISPALNNARRAA